MNTQATLRRLRAWQRKQFGELLEKTFEEFRTACVQVGWCADYISPSERRQVLRLKQMVAVRGLSLAESLAVLAEKVASVDAQKALRLHKSPKKRQHHGLPRRLSGLSGRWGAGVLDEYVSRLYPMEEQWKAQASPIVQLVPGREQENIASFKTVYQTSIRSARKHLYNSMKRQTERHFRTTVFSSAGRKLPVGAKELKHG